MQKIRIKRLVKEAPEDERKIGLTQSQPVHQQISFEEDPMNYILIKYPSLRETLVTLMTDAFKDYLNGIYVVAPRPTTFKVVLHNNQEFFLTWTGKTYICKVDGKKYYLTFLSDKQRATNAIAQLLEMGNPIGKPGPSDQEENQPKGPGEEETAEGEEAGGEEGGGEEEGGEEETLEEGIKKKGRIRIIKEEEEKVSGQSAEDLAVVLWNASLQEKLPRNLGKYKKVYEALKKYSAKYKTPIEKFSGQRIETSTFWKDETGKSSDEPKTDLISKNQELKLSAKKGAAQLMSAEKKEAKATVLAAARTAGIEKETISKLMKLIGGFATMTKTDRLTAGDLKKVDPKTLKSKLNIEAKKILDKADKVQKQVEKELNTLFNENPDFKLAFAYEAMTGHEKFSDKRGEANFVIAFNNSFTDVKLEAISSISSPMVKKIAEKCNVRVAFKSSSYKSHGEKAGYRFFSALRLGLEDLLSGQEELKEVLDNNDQLTEAILDKVKKVFTYLYNKFNSLVEYISQGLEKLKELIKEGLDAVIDFLGLEPEVAFDNSIDFYS